MWTVLSVCLIVIASVIGITEILRLIWLHLMRPKEDPPRILVLFLQEGVAIQQLRSAVEYVSWEGEHSFSKIAAIDCGLSEAERMQVQKAIRTLPQVVFGKNALLEEVEAATLCK